jgi:beta-phosphoglucomutase
MKLKTISERIFADKDLLIFDFDGTIADTSHIHEKAFNTTFAEFKIIVNYQIIKGKSTQDSIHEILALEKISLSNENIKKLIKKKQEIAQRLFLNELKLMEGFLDFFNLINKNFLTCIASSASLDSIKTALEKFNMLGSFDKLISSIDVTNNKPSPEIFLNAIDYFKVNKKQALIFEDSEAGFQAAKSAKIDCIDINKFSWNYLKKVMESS